jgi:ABC-type nitrate/sulfonate/bicarbonate transport system substrate-binding protein
MTAPDASSLILTREPAEAATLRIGLEWFLNPDHLALIAVRDGTPTGNTRIALVLDEPDDHFDGFAALQQRRCDLILSGPVHLVEPMAADCEALGCIFETTGGVLVREDRLGKLRGGEALRVAAPVCGPITDRLCRRILQGWAGNQGFAVAETQIVVDAAGFRHVENLKAGYDAAWLAFANIEVIEAAQDGLAVRLVTAEEAGLPGFSALELVARKQRSAEEIAQHEALIAALEQAACRLQASPESAIALWHAASGDSSESAAAMVRSTLPCLKTQVDRRPTRWQALQRMLQVA